MTRDTFDYNPPLGTYYYPNNRGIAQEMLTSVNMCWRVISMGNLCRQLMNQVPRWPSVGQDQRGGRSSQEGQCLRLKSFVFSFFVGVSARKISL